MRWVVLVIYFFGVATSAFDQLAYAPIATTVGKSMGLLQPDGKTGAPFYVNMLLVLAKIIFIPGTFLSFYLLEQKGIRINVSKANFRCNGLLSSRLLAAGLRSL